jgi:hypothetical protein
MVSSFGWHGIAGAGKIASAFELNADRVLWNHLSYRAKKLLGKVKTEVHLKALPAKAVNELLIVDPAGEALQPSNASVLNLAVDSNISPLLGSDEIYKTRSWFEPHNAGALQRVRLRLGQDKWQKSYRFTKNGVFRIRKKPQDSREENLPLDQWTKIRNHFYPYGDGSTGCAQVLEPSALLYMVSAINFDTVQLPLSLCVFNKKQLHLVNVSVAETQHLKVNYFAKQGENQFRVDKGIDTIKISFQPRALAPKNKDPEEFSFMGLKGDFDIYIDKASRVPVQVSGKINTFGDVDIRLKEANLRPGNS